MKNNNTISVILPIKSSMTGFFEDYFKKCIESIKIQKVPFDEVIIVHTDETALVEFLDSYDFGDLQTKRFVWTEEANFCEQVNYGVKNSTSKWVSILEFDDEYSNIWSKNVKEYMNHYPEVQAFLPIVVDVDEQGVFVGFTNEACFAANITQELGVLTNEVLQTYQNFQISGMVIQKEMYEKYGKLKSNIKLTFGYEFFLRMTQNSVNFMTVPRIGYKHTNFRNGSLFWNYKNGTEKLYEDEVRFWIDSAKKEYFFTEQRDINYEPQEI
jgi:glycosyltransferase involved in cell wall biosynthesis